MNLLPFLLSLGLSETESKVYLKLLALGTSEAGLIAVETRVKRTTVYHALVTLQEKGLVHIVGRAGATRYHAEPPEHLTTMLARRTHELERLGRETTKLLPFFPTLPDDAGRTMPHVEFYRGKEGLQNLSDQTLVCRSKEILAIVPNFSAIQQCFSPDYMRKNITKKCQSGIVTKTIFAEAAADTSLQLNNYSGREARLAPPEMQRSLRSIVMIWDNHVATISLLPELFGLLVTSFDYSETMKALWQTIWVQSEATG